MWLRSEARALSSDDRIISAVEYGIHASIYAPENTAVELTTAQTVIISFLHALKQKDLQFIETLLEVCSTVPQIKSSFLSVWLRDDFCFPREDVAICLSTLGKLLLDGLQFPWEVAATLASLDVKYRIQECFTEADDMPGQILLSTMKTSVSVGTQVDSAKDTSTCGGQSVILDLLSKEPQTTLRKKVSFQLPVEKTSTGTQAGLIVHHRGVLAKPEQSTTGVQTTLEVGSKPLQTTLPSIDDQFTYHRDSFKPGQSTRGVETITEDRSRTFQTMPVPSYGSLPMSSQNERKTPLYIQDLSTDCSIKFQTMPIHSYGSLPMPSQNQRKTPLSINDLFTVPNTTSYREVSAKQEQSTTPIQTTAESASHSGLSGGTGIQLQPASVNEYGSLPVFSQRQMPPQFTTNLPGSGPEIEDKRNIFEKDVLHSFMASSLTTGQTARVEDETKNLNDKTGLVSNKERPISKGMANELLYSAIQNDDAKSIITAINAGADVNHEGVMKKRPLHVAASAGRIEPAIELIHWGADVNSIDSWGETPLFVASVSGHLLMAEVLVAAGANINHRNSEGNRPLHVAASAGQLEIARLLLCSGAEVDHRGESLRTPLHCAAFRGHLSVIGLLLDRGADPMAVEQSGQTPFSLAKSNQQHLVAEYLHYRIRQ